MQVFIPDLCTIQLLLQECRPYDAVSTQMTYIFYIVLNVGQIDLFNTVLQYFTLEWSTIVFQ